ncbi:TPR end-of-group domain-containing protein [Geothrix paludis]|uniref:TPR end-of-group domain-containing protein n=1 Tax=Geothrix paludis TaxID=2922722 RepID=UPI001FAC4C87|nr:transglutaminase domain-containing protein [Geothrix paludis]
MLLLPPALLVAQETPALPRTEAMAVLARPGTAEARVRALVDHLHQRMPWVATDYRNRTVDEILARGMGNCADHARVLQNLLKAGGFESRWVQEINLQAPSERRQASARAKVAESGKGFSVFGYRHNDHRWLEVRDPVTGTWFPADSALGVVGSEAWVAARLGFGPRPAAVADMIVPVFVEAVQPGRSPEPRSEAYLLQAFGAMVGGRIRTLPAWPVWEKAVRALEPHASSAFRGTEDLHAQADLLTALAEAYAALRAQAEAPLAPSAAEFAQQGHRALLAKDPACAADLYDRALAAGLKGAQHPYQGACAHALAGHGDAAFGLLQKALDQGFHEAAALREDADLASLHADPRWSGVLAAAEANARRFRAVHSDPDGARFIATDVDLFWKAYAKLPASPDPAGLLRREYLDRGSAGLQDFIPNRIRSAANLLDAIQRHPRYFAAIRGNTLKAAGVEAVARRSFWAFKALYADAMFPDVYFVVGALDSGGTSSPNGLLLGVDLFGGGPGVPMDEMGPWHREVLHTPADLPSIVAHELIHFQQTHETRTLLGKAFHEGSADFLASLIAEGTFNQAAYAYGYAHEAELWRKFRAEMGGTDASRWLYGSSQREGHPADLGYFMGFRIAQAYYAQAKDKVRAIREILTSSDFEGILRDSRYGEMLEAADPRP